LLFINNVALANGRETCKACSMHMLPEEKWNNIMHRFQFALLTNSLRSQDERQFV